MYTTVADNEEFSLFIAVKQDSFPCKNIKSKLPHWLLAAFIKQGYVCMSLCHFENKFYRAVAPAVFPIKLQLRHK